MTVADAIQLAQNAIAASPGSSEAWHLLAYAHEREKDLESALLAASKAVELSPAEPALWFHRGWLHLKVDAAERRAAVAVPAASHKASTRAAVTV